MNSGITAALKDRFKEPVFGHYLLILATLNWRIWIIALTGEDSFTFRVTEINNYFTSITFFHSWFIGIFLLIVYLYILPYITEFILIIRRKIILQKEDWRLKFEIKLDENRRLGFYSESIGMALNRDVEDFLKTNKEWIKLFEATNNVNISNSNEFINLNTKAKKLCENAEKTLKFTKICWNSEIKKPTFEIILDFKK